MEIMTDEFEGNVMITVSEREVRIWICDENGCKWNSDTCYYAALGGHLEVLKWARDNGCEWGKDTCYFAARNGHLDVLKWARENGCK